MLRLLTKRPQPSETNMYDLKEMARDSAKALRAQRSYNRLNRWINLKFFYYGVRVWARITLPVKYLLYSRANQSIAAMLAAGGFAVTSFA